MEGREVSEIIETKEDIEVQWENVVERRRRKEWDRYILFIFDNCDVIIINFAPQNLKVGTPSEISFNQSPSCHQFD